MSARYYEFIHARKGRNDDQIFEYRKQVECEEEELIEKERMVLSVRLIQGLTPQASTYRATARESRTFAMGERMREENTKTYLRNKEKEYLRNKKREELDYTLEKDR